MKIFNMKFNDKDPNHTYNLKVLQGMYPQTYDVSEPNLSDIIDGIQYSTVAEAIRSVMHRTILEAFYGIISVKTENGTIFDFSNGVTLYVGYHAALTSLFKLNGELVCSGNDFIRRTYVSNDYRRMMLYIAENINKVSEDKNAKVNFIGAGRPKARNYP